MKFTHKFDTNADFLSAYYGPNYTEPWVSYTESEKRIDYNYLDTNGYEYVDLGLPSGTLWATCNVGASSPEEVGGYYAWGEVVEKTGNNAYASDWSDYSFTEDGGTTFTKYNSTDNKTTLDLSDDVAHVVMKGNWRMPTYTQVNELINNTTKIETTINSVSGIQLTSTINNNSIFFPYCGYKYNGSIYYSSYFYQWCSSIYSDKDNGRNFVFGVVNNEIIASSSNGNRNVGTTIRGVITKPMYEIFNGHEYVDLGLPSGTLWATCNVGASAPEQYGGYYAWGEIAEKSEYDWSDYAWGTSSSNITKYNSTDGKTVLDPEDDVVHVVMGGDWLLPTLSQTYELCGLTSTWKTVNGVNGREFSGTNGNTLFIPAAGLKYSGSLHDAGSKCRLWSSSGSDAYAKFLYFDSSDVENRSGTRLGGLSCRGVINPFD